MVPVEWFRQGTTLVVPQRVPIHSSSLRLHPPFDRLRAVSEVERLRDIPQGLKPAPRGRLFGMAKAMP